MRNGTVEGVKFTDDDDLIKNCIVCCKAKMSRTPFKESETKTNNILDIIHSDLCGPMPIKSIGGSRYFITFIDDYSRKVFIYEAIKVFIEFKKYETSYTYTLLN